MSVITPTRRRLAVLAASAIAASTLFGVEGSAHAAVPAATHGATIDYFDDVYVALGANSVFETVTVERFEYILKNKTGNFAFVIGDPKNASTQATIGQIDAVAKAQGIEHIYNFTPKLDGDTLNIWDLSQSNLRTGTNPDPAGGNRTGSGLAQYEALGNRLLTDYLNQDTTPQFTKDATTDPYLFVYNKDRKVGEAEDRIVSSLTGVKTAADLDTPAEVDAYRAQVAAVLDDVPAAQYATNTQFDFNRDEFNRRHFERSVKDADPAVQADKLARFGGDIFESSDATDGFRIETITYPELQHLLKQPGDFPILFGGTWCHNTAAIIKDVNRIAQEQGVKKVYNFDFSLDSTGNGGGQAQHIRDNALVDVPGGKVIRPSHLYGDLVNTYLTNAETQYRTAADVERLGGNVNAVSYYPGGDTTKELKQARKIQVGHVLTYNKDHKDAAGNPAPVVDQAIRQNDDGGNTEHMTEWWFVKGKNLAAGDTTLRGTASPTSEAGSNGLQSQRAFAKEGIDEIETIFKGLAGKSVQTTTTVTGASGTVSEGATPTLDVSVTADGYAPFISLNTVSQSTAPNNTTGKPRGWVALFNGDTKVAEARLKRDGTASFPLAAQTRGNKSFTVRYFGRGDVLEPSQKVVSFFVGDASTTTLADLPSRAFGAGGTTTATVTPGATGKVSLQGLPGASIEGDIVSGTATLAIPASTPAGTYSVTAQYGGDDTYGTSTSEARTLTVTKAPATLSQSVTNTTYGTASKVNVQVGGPAGLVPTGQVSVTVAGKAQTATVDASGKATIVLPKTLAPKSYAVTVVYNGSANLIARSGFANFKVAKGSAKAPTFTTKGKIKAKKAGKATVKVATTAGLAKAGGKVKVVLKKGKTTKTLNVTVKSGIASVKLPKLAKGKWSVKVTYAGDAFYVASKTVSKSLTVK
ncbi:Ig-like domain-containing protein [Aeromicrobium sp. P5_D10]